MILRLGEFVAERDDAIGLASGQGLMPHRVAVLDVEQDHIGLAQKLLKTLWLLGVIRVSTAVQTCVDTPAGAAWAAANRSPTNSG